MQQDLDSAYQLQFDLTPDDQDIGVPQIDVQLQPPHLHAALLDIEPVMSVTESAQREASGKFAHDVLTAVARPLSSPDFSIQQHVDYFPGRSGLEPILPMSCLGSWTGHGPRPSEIVIVEPVVDQDLGTVVLERQLDTPWETRSLFWERDGMLHPGKYSWRIAVADRHGHILAAAEQDVGVALPRQPAVAISSLVLAKLCRAQAPTPGLMHRPTPGEKSADVLHFKVDPLQLATCRLRPEPTDTYSPMDTLHALIRIYPRDKEEKNKPGSWTATFTLHSAEGIQTQQQVPFSVDSQSGLLASAALPLTRIPAGTHSLDVELRGPGLRRPVTESRSLFIEAARVGPP